MKPAKSRQLRKGPTKSRSGSLYQDPVEVFCRVRPNRSDTASCLQVTSSTTVQFSPLESATSQNARGPVKEVQYTFKQVFGEASEQQQVFNVVGHSLVSHLISGRNGLLFAYGVTGSGKTYTMSGEFQNPGITPRCLDLLFTTIGERQASRCIFKPDRMNGFEILEEEEAAAAARTELNNIPVKTPKASRRREGDGDGYLFNRGVVNDNICSLDEDNMYSVYVTYIEIYNNSVYDLLDPVEDISRRLQNKVIREDGNRNMYVHGVTEIEVKSAEEAFEVIQRGQRRKRVAHTLLNEESSRSHSVFTIRLVQAPVEDQCDSATQRKLLTISQLSLVDLAGSERTNRTKTTGQRLREAGSINNSLMTLRTCLEILRENQQTNGNKMVPYRDSRLTHLFKNYFDGEGHVRMIVCVNPGIEDMDETAQVLKFAEMTQEVTIARPTPIRLDIGVTPGRRKGLFRRDDVVITPRPLTFPPSVGIMASSQVPVAETWPSLSLRGPHDDVTLNILQEFLERRLEGKDSADDIAKAEENFRCELVRSVSVLNSQNHDLSAVKSILDQERKKVTEKDTKLSALSAERVELVQKLQDRDELIRCLQQKIEEKDLIISQQVIEKGKVKEKCMTKLAQNKEKMRRDIKFHLNKQREELESEMREKENKIRAVREMLEERHMTPRVMTRGRTRDVVTPANTPIVNAHGTLFQSAVVSNPRHRRSRSAGGGGDRWLDHQPMTPVPLGTVFQPTMRKRKSVTKLTDVRDVVNAKTSKYCLTTQEADTDGELETKLYKGDVIPTATGGAQVILNDVELLKQLSPTNVNVRKRNVMTENTENKCSYAIEGHNKRQKS